MLLANSRTNGLMLFCFVLILSYIRHEHWEIGRELGGGHQAAEHDLAHRAVRLPAQCRSEAPRDERNRLAHDHRALSTRREERPLQVQSRREGGRDDRDEELERDGLILRREVVERREERRDDGVQEERKERGRARGVRERQREGRDAPCSLALPDGRGAEELRPEDVQKFDRRGECEAAVYVERGRLPAVRGGKRVLQESLTLFCPWGRAQFWERRTLLRAYGA